jgi:hypothetical protein
MRESETVYIPKNFLIKNVIVDDDIYKDGKLEIDKCLVEEIKYLWLSGVHTQGCCCGHGKATGFIQVERTDFSKMLELGYEWYRGYPEEFGGKTRYDAFIPKSKCTCNEE